MDKLWAPWRIKYLRSKKERGCIFCQSLKNPGQARIVFEGEHSFVMLNLYPYTNGHILVSPRRHVKDLSRLTDREIVDLIRSLSRAQKILDEELKPAGYNIGINTSAVAGAGVSGHLHLHLVPRWRGDTNFMPVTAGTKVISQSLDELYQRLKRHAESKKH